MPCKCLKAESASPAWQCHNFGLTHWCCVFTQEMHITAWLLHAPGWVLHTRNFPREKKTWLQANPHFYRHHNCFLCFRKMKFLFFSPKPNAQIEIIGKAAWDHWLLQYLCFRMMKTPLNLKGNLFCSCTSLLGWGWLVSRGCFRSDSREIRKRTAWNSLKHWKAASVRRRF